jgi:prepilin-type N-terminal cleavage/methylation domain-containing protein
MPAVHSGGRPSRARHVMVGHRRFRAGGFTLIELLFAVALATVLAGMALPLTATAIDELRTAAAARYLAGRIALGRMDAIKRSTAVALRFEASDPDYAFAPYADGNGNGVRTADIRRGVDPPVGLPQQLWHTFPGVRFGLMPDLPDVDGGPGGGTDGVRIGAARLLTMSPNGTATSGTLYLQGRRAQYAVRVLGATGRTRVLKYDTGAGTWMSR